MPLLGSLIHATAFCSSICFTVGKIGISITLFFSYIPISSNMLLLTVSIYLSALPRHPAHPVHASVYDN